MLDEVAGRLDAHVLALLDAAQRRAGEDMGRLTVGIADGMRGSFARILALTPEGGARPTELAEAAGISKQAVGQRIQELIDRGWMVLDRDPSDHRARIARRTQEGHRVHALLVAAIGSLEDEWRESVGADRYATFLDVLAELARDHLPPAMRERAGPSGDR